MLSDKASYFAVVLEQSRKAKAARGVYEYVKTRTRSSADMLPDVQFGDDVVGVEGVRVSPADKYRVLNVRLHDEHLSPYFQTDMNLFQMLMIDESTEMSIYRTERGWMFVFSGVSPGPLPFGQNGFDLR